MTTEQFEQQLQASAPAVHYLNDTVADFLLHRGHAAKIGEIASQVGKRIGASAKLIRQTLTDNRQFIGEERRWNLSLRTLFHRPVEGAIRETLRLYGKPLTVTALSNELAVLNARAPEFFQAFLPGFLAARPEVYFQAPDGRWGLCEWLLTTEAQDDDELLLRNFFGRQDTMRPLLARVRDVPVTADMGIGDIALALLAALQEPLSTKVISYAAYGVQGASFDARQAYLALIADSRLHMLSGGLWIAAEQLPAFTSTLQHLSSLADVALAEEEAWEGPYQVTPNDLNELFDFMIEHEQPYKLSDLIEAVLEYGKSSPRYQSIFDGLMAALADDGRFQLVGQQTWSLPAFVSADVLQVPNVLLPETIDPALLPDPETDAELEDEGLDDDLALWVHDPRYEDFGSEHEVELSPEMMSRESTLDETRIPLLYNHRLMGTLKLRQADMAFFPTDTPLSCICVYGEGGSPFQVWINSDELLIHGLVDWYNLRDIPIGAVLTFRRGDEPDDFLLSWDGEVDPLIALSEDRVDALINLRDRAESENMSVYEIMRNVLADHADGAHFLTIWAEVNVVRRSPKRVVASNLSSYHCFVQISNTEKWRLDERKVDQGRKKTKKKFIIQ